ncbi:MAG: hypothetical protein JWP72_1307 [Massilia sp.]|nr:hypothetical protein [Massilia sp.]
MLTRHAFHVPRGGWKLRLLGPALLLAPGCWGASQALANPARAPAKTLYRIVPLWEAGSILQPEINDKDQVAFSVPGPGGAGGRAKFHDGRRVHDIGTLGGAESFALGVNDLGQVTGYAMVNAANNFHAFLWSRSTAVTDLGAFGPAPGESLAYDINNKGQAVGYSIRNGQGRPVLWSRKAGMLDLGTLPGAGGGEAVAINDAGQVAGNSGQAFLWTRSNGTGSGMAGLGAGTRAIVMNAAGQVGGAALNAGGFAVSWAWTPGTGGTSIGEGGLNSQVRDINDKGLAVGIDTATGSDIGYVWTRETGVQYFPDLAGGRNASPFAVNNRGQVVGATSTGAFAWTRAGGLVDLNTRIPDAPPGLTVTVARDISDNGAIVADSTTGLVLLVPRAVADVAPVLGSIKVIGPAAPKHLLSFSAGFRDADLRDTHKATWSWGDGRQDAAVVSEKKWGRRRHRQRERPARLARAGHLPGTADGDRQQRQEHDRDADGGRHARRRR